MTNANNRWIQAAVSSATVLILTAPAMAQDSGNADLRWFDHFVVAGGWITWAVLLPLSVATVALAVYYGVNLRRVNLLPQAVQARIEEMLSKRQYGEAVRFSAEDPSVLAYVLNAALVEAGRGFTAMERALEEALEERTARLMRKIEYLNVIGSIAPMIGLFGTVYGMIRLFASIRAAGAIPEPAVIADEISIALVTTFWGLAIAIPALAVFALYRNRIDVLTAECALICERLLAAFKPGADSKPAPAEEPPATVPVA